MQKNKSVTVLGNGLAAKAGEFLIANDLRVTRLGFGAMRITGNGIWGEPADRTEAIRVLRRAVELGINFIDTADSYGPNVSERNHRRGVASVSGRPGDCHQGRFRPDRSNQWVENGKPEHLRSACEGSLRRLRLDPDRSLPVASNRSEGPGRRPTRDAQGSAISRKDQTQSAYRK